MGIIVESTNVMPVHLPKAPRLRKNMVEEHAGFRKIRLHRTLNEGQVVVLEIAECTSASKCLQNSSIIQNNSVILESVAILNMFVTLCFFTYKGAKYL